MHSDANLAAQIAEALRARCTGTSMPEVAMSAAALAIPPAAQYATKRERALGALEGKTRRQLAQIARDLGHHWNDFDLEEAGLRALEEGAAPITEITRRDVAKCFGDDLSGERSVIDLVGSLFPIGSVAQAFLLGHSLAEEIAQHMVRNPGDWSVEYLFERIGAFECSRDRFTRLIEAALHPLCVRGDRQQQLAQAVAAILRRDGYAAVESGQESGYAVYSIASQARRALGSAKNLIFASIGPKPEIGFADAINNDIVVLSNEESCLVYDRPIRRDGLIWAELVTWWSEREAIDAAEAARSLGRRLHASLASDAERSVFETYFRTYRPRLGEQLPALVPQVYLHYDPAVVKRLRHRRTLPRQRMDFLLLLPNRQRVVLEVDGAQHFSKEGQPSLQLYSEMVSADRALRLAGYEIYRFGANELVGPGAGTTIESFFDGLFAIHKIG